MEDFKRLDSFGEFYTVMHLGAPILIHTQYNHICLLDYSTLEELDHQKFRSTIITVRFPRERRKKELKFVILTEDGTVRLAYFHDKQLDIQKVATFEDNLCAPFIVLTKNSDAFELLRSDYILFSLSAQKSSKQKLRWSTVDPAEIVRMEAFQNYQSQQEISPNSAAFIVFQKHHDRNYIRSAFLDFDTNQIHSGPFYVEISQNSYFIAPNFFAQNHSIYSVYPNQEIITKFDPICASTYPLCVADRYSNCVIKSSKSELREHFDQQIIRIESYKGETLTLNTKGTLKNHKTNQKTRIFAVRATISMNNLFYDGIHFNNIPGKHESSQNEITIKDNMAYNEGIQIFEAPHKIVSKAVSEDSVILATAASVHIVTIKGKLILEDDQDSPITCVALSPHYFAVADIDQNVIVKKRSNPKQKVTFQTDLPLSLSITNTTIAIGTSTGHIILRNFKTNQDIFDFNRFTVPVTKIYHRSDSVVEARLGKTWLLVSSNKYSFTKVPIFDPSSLSTYTNGFLILYNKQGLCVYNAFTGDLLATIDTIVRVLTSAGYTVAFINWDLDLVILDLRDGIRVTSQAQLQLSNPLGMGIFDDEIFVMTDKYLYILDQQGTMLQEPIPFDLYPRFCGVTSGGFHIAFSNSFWFISKDRHVRSIDLPKIKTRAFIPITDNRVCFVKDAQIMHCDAFEDTSYSETISKSDKQILIFDCFRDEQGNPTNSIYVVYEDGESVTFDIPPPKTLTKIPKNL